MSAANSNLAAPPGAGSAGDPNAALARQLLHDIDALRKRRLQLQHEIRVRDVAVFGQETNYLAMTTVPLRVAVDPVINEKEKDPKDAPVCVSGAGAIAKEIYNHMERVRQQEEKKAATTSAAAVSADGGSAATRIRGAQSDSKQPMRHLGALQIGDGFVGDEHLRLNRVALSDRVFSLCNYTALATCGMSGLIHSAK
jgi:hypothetical protein